eukprot:1640113-Pyramimonas_sp.AAC.1
MGDGPDWGLRSGPSLTRDCRAHAEWRLTDFCQWGTPWRKRTWLVCGNMYPEDSCSLDRVCTGKA